MDRKNIRLTLAYDGTAYHGWQRQENARTLQEVVEGRIRVITGETVRLTASGRTDAGVHALNQVCNFTTRSAIPPLDLKNGLNALLPDDILVREASVVPPGFHARYDARRKTYEYRILNRRDPDIFLRHYAWHVRPALDTGEMERCLAVLKGRHDFSAFKSAGSANRNPVRTLTRAEIHSPENGVLRIVVEADGFLRHMVRNLVGTLVEAGLGKRDVADIRKVLDSRDRRMAGIKAPARGLFLMAVRYDAEQDARGE